MGLLGLQQYRKVDLHGNLAEASPHQVVQVMLDSVLGRIAEASGHLERGEVAAKGEKISKALGIIEALMLGLDKERGGELALNLERLYDYASRTLLRAHLENRTDLLKEVTSLIREIKLGWDGIAPTAKAGA
jgi:flagellar secretion chaperone FliS